MQSHQSQERSSFHGGSKPGLPGLVVGSVVPVLYCPSQRCPRKNDKGINREPLSSTSNPVFAYNQNYCFLEGMCLLFLS